MTETELQPAPSPSTASWDSAFANLKARYPKVKDSIVFCIHALHANPDIALDDLKAQALMHGIRITGASVTAAQKLMLAGTKPSTPAISTPAVVPAPKPAPRQPRRERTSEVADPARMIEQVVAKLQQQSGAEAERLRAAIRKAIAALEAALA